MSGIVRFTEIELHHISISVLALAIAVSGIGFLPLKDALVHRDVILGKFLNVAREGVVR